MVNHELEGTTLSVYAYVVRANQPVGVRDVMRGANLSSPSVAHRHLQKLEALGLLERNAYGDYVLKEKTSINGHVWIGRNLVPRLILYSLFFMGAFFTEITTILLGYFFGVLVIEASFLFLSGMTLVAMFLFLFEGIKLNKKLGNTAKNSENKG